MIFDRHILIVFGIAEIWNHSRQNHLSLASVVLNWGRLMDFEWIQNIDEILIGSV